MLGFIIPKLEKLKHPTKKAHSRRRMRRQNQLIELEKPNLKISLMRYG